MLFERERRKFYAALNSRYIYGKIPLFHAIVFLIEMAITMRLIAKFNSYYAERPLLTTMITNAILGGIADTTAQILTAYRSRQRNGLGCFFTFMTVAEGGGKRAIWRKFQDVYVPALKANYLLWPAVQILNFRVVPIQFQIPFVSTIGIAWTAYLSLANSAEEE
ncbi:putative integral membrane mpv17 pmp22 [Phaeomoniella chlamydospora]|uniref:Putative integral membrane mpv17 pmp22 n=1 Tax=Phaeomoniella chlamydospora TaxID=158046 RepID=A0A0G2EBX7_PHACM|nr:putative integral membrane mpv17 pmp22 [Phaeomoniella chlamydospora]